VCSSRYVTVTQKIFKFPAFQFFTFTSTSHSHVNLYFFSLETKLWLNHYFIKFGAITIGVIKFGAIAVGAVKFGASIVWVSIKFSEV